MSSCVAGGTYFELVSWPHLGHPFDCALNQETPGVFLDGFASSAWIPLTATSGWLHPSGTQGFARLHRVLLLGYQTSPCQLSIAVANDYATTFPAALTTWTDTDLSGMTTIQLQATASAQKGEAFSFSITDAAPANLAIGSGAGAVLKNVTARLRGKRGENKQLNQTERR
jgi:hypothetical protein